MFKAEATLVQSILKGISTFWLAIKKLTSGPGCISVVVDVSVQVRYKASLKLFQMFRKEYKDPKGSALTYQG